MAKKSGKKQTPMMRQYDDIKSKHPEAMLLFRVGDFYETFGSDAEKASKTLDIILTKRSNGSASEVALAGFPHHALQTYLPKLVRAGHRVAIVEQLEDPKLVKGLVKRGVTDMVTPGINLNSELLSGKEHNYLASLYPAKKGAWGLAVIEISTGSFYYAEHEKDELLTALSSYAPKEVIHPRDMDREFRKKLEEEYYLFGIDSWAWEKDYTFEQLTSHFKTNSLSGFGLQKGSPGAVAAGAVLHHLKRSEYHTLDHISSISRISLDDFMWLDGFTVQNLELFKSNSPGGTSTLDIIDKTTSPMGGRLLRTYLALPMLNKDLISKRHDAVEALLELPDFLNSLVEVLQGMPDIERICSRVATGRINPKEMARLREGLKQSATMVHLVKEESWSHPEAHPDVLESLYLELEQALVDDPSVTIGKGESIRSEFDEELARLRGLLHDATGILESIRDREASATGIPSLKLAFNNVFGYYLEVRNSHKDKVPEEWHRKQTLVNAERYITDELKKFESEVFGAEEQIKAIELKLFTDVTEKAKGYLSLLLKLARWVATTDVLASFATVAKTCGYCRPSFNENAQIHIENGRHPVIEHMLPEEQPYIANGISMHAEDASIAMITGPNMSGKSALLRQVAIIQVLAQIGSYIPAGSANLPIIDRLFVRVGATDNLSKGESTFMVEMNETASILNNISNRSLVVLDEIGRGTSTFDGVSIAWGIAEFLHQHPARPLVLFATHYHELNEMTTTFKKVQNYHVAAEEHEGEIVFTRQLKRGGTAHSFGLHVAKLAGIPGYVLNRAELVLKELEQLKGKSGDAADSDESGQLNFFSLDRPELEDLADEIENIDVDQLKPIEALMMLHTLKEKLTKK
ncbi:MAG: DNA mismatch repair protein MutS [Flavobacteriales bacterium]|nr:DNA mismatch repair protein MutS [Flavobacteriales bacterium]|tara:strand:+ start:1208 stop:3799 length:2592 start_codon:yes stop_codon:yes gene_type:complete